MTLDELIASERSAVDHVATVHRLPSEARKRLYGKMRKFSVDHQRHTLPNDVSVRDAALQLNLRAADLAGVSAPSGHFL